MTNVFEELALELKSFTRGEIERVLSALPSTEHRPGIDLTQWISLRKACDIFEIVPSTLGAHKNEIEHIKRFGQIYFKKESLAAYMEGGKHEVKMKTIMRTKPGRQKKAA